MEFSTVCFVILYMLNLVKMVIVLPLPSLFCFPLLPFDYTDLLQALVVQVGRKVI